jgi:hypothetical protein
MPQKFLEQPDAAPAPSGRLLCRYCFAALEDPESELCDEECADGSWQFLPMIDGEA